MKAVIFCGGPGTRLWPISRKAKPKQLEKLFGARSTAQLTFDRIQPLIEPRNIYIATSREYKAAVEKSFPEIPKKNFFYEPAVRDVGPAVGYALFRLEKICPEEPVAILWSDHLIEDAALFRRMLKTAQDYSSQNPDKILYFGCRPTFPNENLGWIEISERVSKKDGVELCRFRSWTYRPNLEKAKKWFMEKSHVWNMGYFVATPKFIVGAYKKYAPDLYTKLKKIQQAIGTDKEAAILERVYPKLEKIHFDDAIVVKLPKEKAVVLTADIGWSDPGALNALKEMLEKEPGENVTKGKVTLRTVKDCLVYNDTDNLAAAIGVAGLLIVVTKDVVLVCDKEKVPEIKKLVQSFEGTELEKYI